MSILNYFKIKAKANHPAKLPDLNDLLSAAVPLSTIAAVNKKVSSTMEKSASTDKGRPLLIREEADRQVREYVRFLQDSGSAVIHLWLLLPGRVC